MGTKRERQRFGLPFLLYYICSVILIINAMKKFVLFIFTILLYIGSASAQRPKGARLNISQGVIK